eukprot:scaffold19935_cov108-Isochrysis_galbana.AAC.12
MCGGCAGPACRRRRSTSAKRPKRKRSMTVVGLGRLRRRRRERRGGRRQEGGEAWREDARLRLKLRRRAGGAQPQSADHLCHVLRAGGIGRDWLGADAPGVQRPVDGGKAVGRMNEPVQQRAALSVEQVIGRLRRSHGMSGERLAHEAADAQDRPEEKPALRCL